MSPLRALLALLCVLCLAGCPTRRGNDDVPDPPDDDDDSAVSPDDDDSTPPNDDDDTEPSECEDDESYCLDTTFRSCQGGQWVEEECAGGTPLCDGELGCVACLPSLDYCDGNQIMSCSDDGLTATPAEDCGDLAQCVGGECINRCDLAAFQYSYLGCNFLAVTNPNISLNDAFIGDFGVVIGAPMSGPDAHIEVHRGTTLVTTATIPSGHATDIQLDMVPELVWAQQATTLVDAAYEISSDTPVTAYQFNPLHYDIGGTPSYTNDASLLLPEHALDTDYRISTLPLWGLVGSPWSWSAGFFTVAATQDGTTVTFTPTAETLSGNPGPIAAGTPATVTLDRGDVLGIYSTFPYLLPSDPDYCADQGWEVGVSGGGLVCTAHEIDLTGTVVTSSAPVAVWAGHPCRFIPAESFACDHLEEQMLPTSTWGNETILVAPMHPDGTGPVNSYLRVLALLDDTTVWFDPTVEPSVSLDAGDFFDLQTDADLHVSATGPILVTQFLAGQDLVGSGDPAMGTGIPLSQGRTEYDFGAPSTFVSHWIGIAAPVGAVVELDGSPVGGWTPVSSSGWSVARVQVSEGSHHIESSSGDAFTITSYGYAPWTSYLYPGGLNLGR
jgi:hypothetical protein